MITPDELHAFVIGFLRTYSNVKMGGGTMGLNYKLKGE